MFIFANTCFCRLGAYSLLPSPGGVALFPMFRRKISIKCSEGKRIKSQALEKWKIFPFSFNPCNYFLFLRLKLGKTFRNTMQWSPVWMLLQFMAKKPVEKWAVWAVSVILLFQHHSLFPHRHKNNIVSVLQLLCSYIGSCRRCDWDIYVLRVITSLGERELETVCSKWWTPHYLAPDIKRPNDVFWKSVYSKYFLFLSG